MLSYPDTDIVRMAVDTVGFEAFAFGSSALHFPQKGGGLNLALNRAIVPLPHARNNRPRNRKRISYARHSKTDEVTIRKP